MKKINKKGQAGLLAFVFALIIFVIIWAIWFGKYLNETIAANIAANGITGIEAFLLVNMNLWIFLGLVISVAFAAYFGGQQ